MNYKLRAILFSIIAIACLSCKLFKRSERRNKSNIKAATTSSTSVKDTTANPKNTKLGKLKAYGDVITKTAISNFGLFKTHQVDNKYFFEIPDSLLETDLLIVNRISKGASGSSSGMIGYSGDMINESVVRFTKGPNNKVFIKSMSFTERSADSTDNGMYRSVRNSSLQPIVAAFDVKTMNKDSTDFVIEVTDYLNGDNEVLFFSGAAKSRFKLGALQTDKSYISGIQAYPENLEIKTVKTYSRVSQASMFGGTGGGNATYELNSSIIRLPKQPMTIRIFDDRVGYFGTGYVDFDRNPQGVVMTGMITRWRLEPKKEDEARYMQGELVEPKQPIIYYIDPATPKKWVPYLIQGVNDWNAAFEQAGFKNAIVAKEAPSKTLDSSWSIESARHNVIVYKPSAIANASGPHVHDPRTGEILETHIDWYHNVMQLLRNWYMIQTAAVDPKARKMKFDDELMGQLIRFVSSHEVGHTLGLRHNFGSSSTVPVEKLRDKAWVEANGHTPSIMDYARFNYVAQPEDGISEKGIFPRIGDYDKWAIEWGYRWWPKQLEEDEATRLNKWIIEKTSNNKRLWFGHEMDERDPRSQSEDLGDDAVKASVYGINNLKRIVPHLKEWTKQKNGDYDDLKNMYLEVTIQFNRYLNHVVKNVGGIMTDPKSVEESGKVIRFVSKEQQRSAIQFLNHQLFTTPKWLLNKEIYSLTGTGDADMICRLQSNILFNLFGGNTFDRLLQSEEHQKSVSYSISSMIKDLKQGVWHELDNQAPIDVYRRNLQKAYIDEVSDAYNRAIGVLQPPPAPAGFKTVFMSGTINRRTDGLSLLKAHLKELKSSIRNSIKTYKDKKSRSHLQDCLERIDFTLKPQK